MGSDDDIASPTPGREAATDLPPWLRWRVGERVVVRYRLDDDRAGGSGRHLFGDALGDLVEVRPDGVVVRTRRGDVSVPASAMVTGKKVPPPPDPSRYRRSPPS